MNNLPHLEDKSVRLDYVREPKLGEFGFALRTFACDSRGTETTVETFSSASYAGIMSQVLAAVRAAQRIGYQQALADVRHSLGLLP